MLDKIRIVLVNTSHPGNIGAAARAMKNMGLNRLYLVQPNDFPSCEATARASSADNLLESAIITGSLEEAIADCGMVIGTSAQQRGTPLEILDARTCAEFSMQLPKDTEIAIVFGTERSGLNNQHLTLCNRQVIIPTIDEYSSLNLAQAVQVICYELRMAAINEGKIAAKEIPAYDLLAGNEDMQKFYQHLEQTLIDIEYLNPNVEKKLLPRLKRFFNRAGLEVNELNIFRGIFNAAQKHVKTRK